MLTFFLLYFFAVSSVITFLHLNILYHLKSLFANYKVVDFSFLEGIPLENLWMSLCWNLEFTITRSFDMNRFSNLFPLVVFHFLSIFFHSIIDSANSFLSFLALSFRPYNMISVAVKFLLTLSVFFAAFGGGFLFSHYVSQVFGFLDSNSIVPHLLSPYEILP